MIDLSNEAAIRARAYQLWEESGGGEGNHEEHWRRAEAEQGDTARSAALTAEESAGVPIDAGSDDAGGSLIPPTLPETAPGGIGAGKPRRRT